MDQWICKASIRLHLLVITINLKNTTYNYQNRLSKLFVMQAILKI